MRHQLSQKFYRFGSKNLLLLLAIRPYESQFIGCCCLFSHRAAPRHGSENFPTVNEGSLCAFRSAQLRLLI